MSSSINLTFDSMVPIDDWAAFCEEHSVVYSPNTVGQNTFYQGQVEVVLEEEGTVAKRGGRPDWATARPPVEFSSMRVKSFYSSNLDAIGNLANQVAATFPCKVSSDPELSHLITGLDRSYERGWEYEDEEGVILSTDFADAWETITGGITAKVEAGRAVITETEENERFVLRVDGVERATFRDVETAMCYAGRCDWDWWGGPSPEQNEALDAPLVALPSP